MSDRTTAPAQAPEAAPFRSATVARQFDRRAPGFARVSAITREVGSRMMERLQAIRHEAGVVLDLGCGDGALQAALQRRFAGACWIGVDLSLGMLGRVRAPRRPASRWMPRALRAPLQAAVCATAERLPLGDASVDCVFSNLMLNWHPAPHRVFAEAARVLREGGLLLFSSLGPRTLIELRQAYGSALPQSQPIPFVDMHDLGDMMLAAGFSSPVMDSDTIRLTYPSVRQMLAEMRALGGNPRDDRPKGLPSGRQARDLLARLEALRDGNGRIGLTFEISYGLGWKDAPRAPAGASGAIPLEALRAQLRRSR